MQLVDRHAAELFRLALSLAATRADAEDIVQETFLGAYRGMRKFDARASVKTWLKRILVRQAARSWNKSRASRKIAVAAGRLTQSLGPRPRLSARAWRPVAWIERSTSRRCLRLCRGSTGRSWWLREFEQMSYTEIAESLGVPQGTVESRLHRARAELKSKLQSYKS